MIGILTIFFLLNIQLSAANELPAVYTFSYETNEPGRSEKTEFKIVLQTTRSFLFTRTVTDNINKRSDVESLIGMYSIRDGILKLIPFHPRLNEDYEKTSISYYITNNELIGIDTYKLIIFPRKLYTLEFVPTFIK